MCAAKQANGITLYILYKKRKANLEYLDYTSTKNWNMQYTIFKIRISFLTYWRAGADVFPETSGQALQKPV